MTRTLSSFSDELIAIGDDLPRLLELVARRAAEVVGEAAVLTTVSTDGTRLDPVAVFHADPEVREFVREVAASEPYPVGVGLAGTAAARREPVVVREADQVGSAAPMSPHTRRFLERYPMRSALVVPMMAFGDVLGTLGAVRIASTDPYDDEDVVALEALAERAALALAEARRAPGRVSPAEFEAIFTQSNDGVLLTAPDGRVLAANPAACRILGRSEAEICREGRAGLLVDDERTRAAVERRAARGSVRADLRMRRGSGEVFTADVSSTIFNRDGVLRTSVIFKDITDRERARAELELQHNRLELLHQVTVAINEAEDVHTALQSTLDIVGESTGWPLGDALLLCEDGLLRASSSWRVTDGERFGWFRSAMHEVELRPGSGLAGWVVEAASPVWVEDLRATDAAVRAPDVFPGPLRTYVGVPIMVGTTARGVLELFSDEVRPRDDGLLALLSDLGTQLGRALERTEVETAYRRVAEERTAFVGRAAHELRSPIASLMVAVGVLAGHDLPDPQDRQLLELIVDSTEHLDRLVNRLLDLSTLEHATPHLTVEPLDVDRVVARAIASCPGRPGDTVTVDVPAGVRVMGDELSVEQILTNLVANAHRYGGDRIFVEASPEDGCVRLCVSDNGPGVDPAIEESLFEPFVRGASDQGEGAGLGLAISRRLADAMQGTLVYERDDGVSRFVVELPAAA